ncbi:hypothetical protein WICPIJ_008046 [Wickerhamomyces pijperi]|uniref:AB hydrolase-1 domain-containing protein n=1 Tax=Wickerhamomyces pijperi TaxID=599730 RepID=A0A9P8TJU2_WICPI|nr:hypothetical protein WICPIJ_008046 [Wickerhamomyces pijperi]
MHERNTTPWTLVNCQASTSTRVIHIQSNMLITSHLFRSTTFRRLFPQQIRTYYQTYESLTESLYSKTIPSVPLSYEKLSAKSDSVIPQTPILILHGLFGSKSSNRTIGQRLSEKLSRDVYLLDLRNHGDSPHDPDHSYPALSRDIEQFMDDQRIEDAIVIGHSMGAKAAMALSLRSPALVKLLISVDNAPVNLPPTSSFVKYVELLEKIEGMRLTKLKEAKEIFMKVEPNELVCNFILQNLKRDKADNNVLKSRVPLSILHKAIITGEISSWKFSPDPTKIFTKPTLFLRGLQSNYVADDYLRDLGQYFTNFEVKGLDCGHFVLYEKAQESIDVISDFIERHDEDY